MATKILPKYDVAIVEAVVLELAAELDPEHLPPKQFLLEVVGDPHDEREIKTGMQAIDNLRDVGLFTHRDDEFVEPTPAGLRAVDLFARRPERREGSS